MIWITLQLVFLSVSGMIIPDTVAIPESTLIPPAEIIQIIEEQEQYPIATIPEADLASDEHAKPSFLFIPSINVSAAIDPVRLTEKGAVGVPTDPARLGWFDKSAVPGKPGSAVIDGHRGWRRKTPAVFDRLHEVEIEDLVIVMDEQGNTTPFFVYDIQTYSPDESPDEVFTLHPDAHLNLITCNGEWDAEAGSATKRLVVFTKKLEVED